jgi:hypothetical protein
VRPDSRIGPAEERTRRAAAGFAVGLLALLKRNPYRTLTVVLTLIVGWYIPVQIDSNATRRDRRQVCVQRVLEMRAELVNLQRGYLVDRSDKPNRLADWDSNWKTVEIVGDACESEYADSGRPFLQSRLDGQGSNFQELASEFRLSQLESAGGSWTGKAEDSVALLLAWTTKALAELNT